MSSVGAERPALLINALAHHWQVAATYLSPLAACESLSLKNLPLETRRYVNLFGEEFRAMPVVLRLVLNFIPHPREHWFSRLHTFCCWWGGVGEKEGRQTLVDKKRGSKSDCYARENVRSHEGISHNDSRLLPGA